MASIRKKGRGYEARVKIHGTTRSKSFATMQQARAWARSAELDIVATPEPVSVSVPATTSTTSITLADALKRYEAEVLPKLKEHATLAGFAMVFPPAPGKHRNSAVAAGIAPPV